MTTPTRQEIIDAYESLDFLCVCLFNNPDTRLDKLAAAQTAIEKVLPPKPQPTMAEVEWDDDKHFLAGATTPIGREAVMLWHDDEATGNIITTTGEWRRDQLTPTGKRYMLTEVQE